MGTRKCCVKDCNSNEANEGNEGITYHRFPQSNHAEKWIKGKLKLIFHSRKYSQ